MGESGAKWRTFEFTVTTRKQKYLDKEFPTASKNYDDIQIGFRIA
jgi:hypothetical protein